MGSCIGTLGLTGLGLRLITDYFEISTLRVNLHTKLLAQRHGQRSGSHTVAWNAPAIATDGQGRIAAGKLSYKKGYGF